MISLETIGWVAICALILFLLHSYLLAPTMVQHNDDIVIDSRLIGESDDDLTNPSKVAFLVYKSIAMDLKNRVECLELETSKLRHFRNVFTFYIGAAGFCLAVVSFYLKFVAT